MIEKSDEGISLTVAGDASHILAELTILVEVVQENIKEIDVREILNDPIKKCLTGAYLKAMRRPKGAKEKEPERKADGVESEE